MSRGDPAPAEAFARWQRALREAGFAAPLQAESVPVANAAGRVLAADATAVRPSPPVSVSAMDGIAVRAADTANAPCVLGEADFAEVDTGAPVPEGFDAVIRREQVEHDNGRARIVERVDAGRDVRPVGEDIPLDEPLLPTGRLLSPIDIGLLAAAGHAEVAVRIEPRVAVIPTGDELRSPGEPLDSHHIIDSNCPMLAGQARADGCLTAIHGRVPDDATRLGEEVMRAVLQNDLVLLVAGSSRGRRDHSREVLDALGVVAVDGVAVRPGHPVLLAVVGTTPVIGVPGYPVSAAFTYELFAHPLVSALLGRPAARASASAVLAVDAGGREDADCMVAVRLDSDPTDGLRAVPLARRAGALRALAGADGYIVVPPGVGLAAGTRVTVRLLRDL